jgi:uncharacterized protein YkwD
VLQRAASPLVVVLLALFVSTSFVGADDPVRPLATPDFAPWIDTADREQVVAAHRAAFERPTPDLEWTGDADQCRPGDSSDALRRETMIRISYYRAMAGVPAVVIEDPLLSDKAQAAALMMSAEGELTHHPESGFACFSSVGRHAAANSNLYLGRTGPSAIDGYIEDPGDRNVDVGHRSTILHPPTERMGVGHVAGNENRYPANALWVFDNDVFFKEYEVREANRFVAWPPRGFVPRSVVYPRWSFALQEADFEAAVVTMSAADGEEIPLDVVARMSKDGEIPSSVIVWEPRIDLDAPVGGGDRTFDVTVADVVAPEDRLDGGLIDVSAAVDPTPLPKRSTYTYRVTIIDPGPDRSSLRGILSPLADTSSGLVGAVSLDR